MYSTSSARCPSRLAVRADRFTVALIVAGMVTGLLTLAGAKLLDTGPITVTEVWEGCQVFSVTGEPGDNAHIRLENPRPETIRAHVVLVGVQGGEWPSLNQSLTVAPWAGADLEFSTSAAGGLVQLRSSVKNLHTNTELHHAGGAASEILHGSLCLDELS